MKWYSLSLKYLPKAVIVTSHRRLPNRRSNCKTTRNTFSALSAFLFLSANARAEYHPPEPPVNLGDTSFLDAIAGPGFMLEEIGDGNHSGKVVDGSGNSTAANVNSISGLTHVAWISKSHLFGAWYGVELVQAVAHVSAGAPGSASGFGDLTVSPLILQWEEKKIGQVRIVQRAVFDFDLPTGEYQPAANVNLSGHAFTVHPYYAVTVFPTEHLETSWRVHYLWNAKNDDPPSSSMAQSTQAGQAVHFNATVSYSLPHGFWVGANGYFLKQITDPAINGVSVSDSPEQVGAIGPGAMWNLGQCMLYANAYHEFGAENRTEGNKLVLRMQWIFPN
jgi:hypothetical protein